MHRLCCRSRVKKFDKCKSGRLTFVSGHSDECNRSAKTEKFDELRWREQCADVSNIDRAADFFFSFPVSERESGHGTEWWYARNDGDRG